MRIPPSPFCSMRSRLFHEGDIVAVKLGQGNVRGTRVILHPTNDEVEGTVSERAILFTAGAMPAPTAALLQAALGYARNRNTSTHLIFLAAVHDYHVALAETSEQPLPALTDTETDPA